MEARKQDRAVAAIERAMVAIRRSQTRRALSRLGRHRNDEAVDPTLFGVLDVIEEQQRPCTVTEIATTLGVDQPRASRLVARAVAEGLLARHSDQHDGRRALLALTPRAHDRLARTHAFRQEIFAQAMADWSGSDRATFARLLTRFVTSFEEVARSPSPPLLEKPT
jgi:DNA-binding MarR family transcriptional regulator